MIMTQLIDDLFQVHAKKDNGPKKSLNLADYKKKRGLIWRFTIKSIRIPRPEQDYYVVYHDYGWPVKWAILTQNFLYADCFWHYCQGNHVDSTNFNGTKLTSKIVLITILSTNCMTIKQMLLSIIQVCLLPVWKSLPCPIIIAFCKINRGCHFSCSRDC